MPIVIWPIYAVNRVFDAVASLFGPFGRWLTYPVGRQLMGVAGILLLVAALGWAVAEWYGFDWPW